MLDRHLELFLGRISSVLDLHAASACSSRHLRAVGMHHRAQAQRMDLVTEQFELSFRQCGRCANPLARGREDLDEIGALRFALAHHCEQLLVRRVRRAGHPLERRQHPRPREAPVANGVAEGLFGHFAHRLHGCETAQQRIPRSAGDAERRFERRFLLGRNPPVLVEVGAEMDVGVDPARQHRVAAQVDDGALLRCVERRDLSVGDADAYVLEDGTMTVERMGSEDDDRACGRWRRGYRLHILGIPGDTGQNE